MAKPYRILRNFADFTANMGRSFNLPCRFRFNTGPKYTLSGEDNLYRSSVEFRFYQHAYGVRVNLLGDLVVAAELLWCPTSRGAAEIAPVEQLKVCGRPSALGKYCAIAGASRRTSSLKRYYNVSSRKYFGNQTGMQNTGRFLQENRT
jgi:hypothetical protein